SAMVAPSEVSEDLVADGAHCHGNIVDAHPVADQDGKIAAAHRAVWKLGHVHCHQIHGDTAGDRTPLAGDDHLCGRLAFGGAGRTQKAVRIADSNDCDAAWARGRESCAIADAVALIDGTHLDDAPFKFHHRTHGI